MADRIVQLTDKNGNRIFPYVKGSPGDAATISVGTTTTLPAGSSATVTNSGTSSAAVFDFGIPTGDKGDKGDTGNPGPANTLTIGTVQGGAIADATITGTSPNQTLNLTLPKGDTGAAGQDGADGFSPIANVSKVGDTATITITDENGTTTATVSDGTDGAPGSAATVSAGTTTTLPAGSSASVVNSGTSSAAVFDFSIPQGANGPANTLSIGTVQGGATASATITGTSPNQTLNLTLPKGDTGNAGEKGDPGKGLPIGAIIPFSGELLPEGYLDCDGSAISRTTYAELFSVVGTRYGAGDGSTTFNLPNLNGKVAVGQDANDASFDTLGETGGEKTHTLTTGEIPGHTHTASMCSITSSGSGAAWQGDFYRSDYWNRFQNSGNNVHDYYGNGTLHIQKNTGGDGAHNNLQPYIVTKYIIKWKDMAATVAEVKDQYSTSSTDVYSASYINNVVNNTNDILNMIYPVGSIYMSTNNVSPATFIGGQWERIQDRFLLSAGSTYTAGNTGGSATHSHVLSANGWAKIVLKAASKIIYREKSVPGWQSNYQNSTGSGSGSSSTESYGAELGGNTDSATTLPPYLVVYVWKRTQ